MERNREFRKFEKRKPIKYKKFSIPCFFGGDHILESKFQAELKKELSNRFEGCIIFKCDPQQRQGTPDLLILYEDKWAALEVKRSATASKRPNQDYRVEQMNDMSYANYIYPENKEIVLDDLERFFEAH